MWRSPSRLYGRSKRLTPWRFLTFLVTFVILTIVLLSLSINHRVIVKTHRTKNLLKGAQCVREVLRRLNLPPARSLYWMETFAEPLPLANLSSTCRSFLTPAPVSPHRRSQLACFLPEPWFRYLGQDGWERVRGAVHIIRDTFQRAHVPLLIESGTALGSWRLHGQIPYDPDIDFAVFRRDKERAIKVIESIKRTHPNLINVYKNGNSDFWRMDVIRVNKTRLFQIDLFVHTLREKDRMMDTIQKPFHLRADRLLPLVQRPFAGALFLTFRNMQDYTAQMYGRDVETACTVAYWIPYFFKIPCETRRVKCSELNYFFHFVHRWLHPTGQLVEVLFNRSHALSVFYSPDGV